MASKWLKSYANKNSIYFNDLALRTGVGVSTAKNWLRGVVPRRRQHWYRIAQALDLPSADVVRRYISQLEAEGRIARCRICDTRIILWRAAIILCGAHGCRKLYDLERKRKLRELGRRPRISYRDVNYLFSSPVEESTIDKSATRAEISCATERYLKSGGVITALPPGDAEGTDPLTVMLIREEIDSLLYE